MKAHYERACMDACFAAGADPSNPPKNLDEAMRLCSKNIHGISNQMAAKSAVYACFARAFDRAMKEPA